MKKALFVIFILFFGFTASFVLAETSRNAKPKVQQPLYSQDALESSGERILFIVDFSNSMNDWLANKTKIRTALDTLNSLLPRIPKSKYVGLRVYGHKSGFTQYQGCTASQLLIPIAQNNSFLITKTLASLSARGYTPITYSLKQAVKYDFGDYQGKKRIILLTDGGENCDENPCSYVIDLVKTRPDIKIDVIAFAVNDNDASSQLRCTALTMGGKFYNANTAAQLADSLKNSLDIEKDVQGQLILH